MQVLLERAINPKGTMTKQNARITGKSNPKGTMLWAHVRSIGTPRPHLDVLLWSSVKLKLLVQQTLETHLGIFLEKASKKSALLLCPLLFLFFSLNFRLIYICCLMNLIEYDWHILLNLA